VNDAAPARRGRLELYAVAFVLMLAAAITLAIASVGSLNSIRLLWFSAVLSALAIVVAVASVVARGR
jgi:hypothetical protein